MWHIWPPTGSLEFLRIAMSQDRYDGDGLRVAVVFICTAVESLLEDILDGFLWKDTKAGPLVQLVLDSYPTITRREQLFKRLRDKSLKQVMADHGLGDFYAQWKTLVTARNGLIHGDYWGSINDRWPTVEVSTGCLHAFAVVNNDGWDHFDKTNPTPPPGRAA